jgi:predicted site-specific integrase-resolvase
LECVEAALATQGNRPAVVDPAGIEDDLVWDITVPLTSNCTCLYGRRVAADRDEWLVPCYRSL